MQSPPFQLWQHGAKVLWRKILIDRNIKNQTHAKTKNTDELRFLLLVYVVFILKEAPGYAASSKNSFDFESSSDNYTL